MPTEIIWLLVSHYISVTTGWLRCGLARMQDPNADVYKEKLNLFKHKTKGAAEPDYKKKLTLDMKTNKTKHGLNYDKNDNDYGQT